MRCSWPAGSAPPRSATGPGWLGQWFSLFPNVQTIVAQFGAILLVLGSYLLAEYLRVWRPRRRGLRVASIAAEPPAAAMAEVCHTAETLAESAEAADAEMNARLVHAMSQKLTDATVERQPRRPALCAGDAAASPDKLRLTPAWRNW